MQSYRKFHRHTRAHRIKVISCDSSDTPCLVTLQHGLLYLNVAYNISIAIECKVQNFKTQKPLISLSRACYGIILHSIF